MLVCLFLCHSNQEIVFQVESDLKRIKTKDDCATAILNQVWSMIAVHAAEINSIQFICSPSRRCLLSRITCKNYSQI